MIYDREAEIRSARRAEFWDFIGFLILMIVIMWMIG